MYQYNMFQKKNYRKYKNKLLIKLNLKKSKKIDKKYLIKKFLDFQQAYISNFKYLLFENMKTNFSKTYNLKMLLDSFENQGKVLNKQRISCYSV